MNTEIFSRASAEKNRQIELRGVRVHNLKNLDLDIPLNRLIVICGVSGSGKSSLAFETLFAEGQRRYIESFSTAARQNLERIERPDADRIAHVPVAIAIRSEHARQNRADSRATVGTVGELLDGLRMLFARAGRIVCPECGQEVRAHSPTDIVRTISELPAGTRCQLGFTNSESAGVDPSSTWLARGFSRAIWDGVTHDLSTKPAWPTTGEVRIVADRLVAGKASPARIIESGETAFREGAGRCWLAVEIDDSTSDRVSLVDGRSWRTMRFSRRLECTNCSRTFLPPAPRLFNHLSSGACPHCRGTGRDPNESSATLRCTACDGTRLRYEARAVQLASVSIASLFGLTSFQILRFLDALKEKLAADELRLIELIRADSIRRLKIVGDLGLDYLTLDRAAETLSGGESRRLMLSAVIGSRITGTLVVVDEPSAGLAEAELPRLVRALRWLQRQQNSVVVVDHSPIIVAAADHVIEIGPGAGPSGGLVVYQGPPSTDLPSSLQNHPAENLAQKERSATSAERAPKLESNDGLLTLTFLGQGNPSTRHLNLSQHVPMIAPVCGTIQSAPVQFKFPLRRLCVLTGPSGSGKTSLLVHILHPALCRQLGLPSFVNTMNAWELTGGNGLVDVVVVDQSPLTRSSRSNPATWLEVFDEIRHTFATTVDARERGFTAQHFSFNSAKGGRCRSCLGTGVLKQDMQFLPDVTLTCPECHGTRYRHEILDVKYRGRSIADVLAMSVSEAATFFRSQPRIQSRFQMLKQIGLDYLVLGQPSETLSGGEAQRLKLAARISAPNRGPCLIICDEPTNGLHSKDIHRLVICFRELIANGHSLILADNSPELIAAADYVLELAKN